MAQDQFKRKLTTIISADVANEWCQISFCDYHHTRNLHAIEARCNS